MARWKRFWHWNRRKAQELQVGQLFQFLSLPKKRVAIVQRELPGAGTHSAAA